MILELYIFLTFCYSIQSRRLTQRSSLYLTSSRLITTLSHQFRSGRCRSCCRWTRLHFRRIRSSYIRIKRSASRWGRWRLQTLGTVQRIFVVQLDQLDRRCCICRDVDVWFCGVPYWIARQVVRSGRWLDNRWWMRSECHLSLLMVERSPRNPY